MYLKSLEIQGFKSFPDRVSLKFDKGLTAVVGPNGSGKSNIGDSVRWVLGEQSTRTLRGSKMEDVIFSGTVTRKPMGFAAVTINIDNSDDTFENLGEEVCITRKLYKSGESEYMINGKQCRLKDINELFMDTGLGRDGYSIIGQGRIAEIVGAKSSERRDIFEEAAGISKFRYRKAEAERKLRAAEENITRLDDIISELEKRVAPLKIQAEKAQKFLVLAEKRKKLEISLWVHQLGGLREKIDSLDEKILIAENEYYNIVSDIQREEERLQASYRQMQECTVKSDGIRRKMIEEEQEASQKKSDIAVCENDIHHSEEAIKAAEENIEKAEEKKRDCRRRIGEAEKKAESLRGQREELKSEIGVISEKLCSAEERNGVLGESAGKIREEISGLQIKRNEFRLMAETAHGTSESEKKRLDEIISGSSDIEKSVGAYRESIAENRAQLEKNGREKKSLTNRLEGFRKLYESRKGSFDSAKEELEKILYELKEKFQRQKILTELENSMEGFAGSVKSVLRASKQGRIKGIYGTVAQNVSVEQVYAIAVETALGGAMQNIIVENEETAKRCIQFLKEQKGGRATFLPITSVRGNGLQESGLEECDGFISTADKIVETDERFRKIFLSLLGRTVIAEDIDTAVMIAKKYGYRFRIVTLDGQIINAGGSFTGGSAQKSTGIITRKNEINALDGEIKNLTSRQTELETEIEKLRKEADKLRFEAENVKNLLKENETQEIRLNAEISSLETLIVQLTAQAENSGKQIAETEEKIKAAEKAAHEAEEAESEAAAMIEEAEKRLADVQKEREAVRLERAELSQEISRLTVCDAEISKDIQAQAEEIRRTGEEYEMLKGGNDRFREEISRHRGIIDVKRGEIERLRTELENMKSDSDVYMEQIRQIQAIHDEHSRRVKEIQKGIKEYNGAKEKQAGEVARLTGQKETAVQNYDSVIRQIFEVYEMTYSEAAGIAEEISDTIRAQSELSEIKGEIRSLGDVNPDAVDEYKEVSERYGFLSAQMKDVQKSKAELEKIIDNLMEEMRRIFSESFSIINENFKTVFRELFGGGKAELILTDPTDVLESGIEISVAPPGKVIKNLISLSGGEQAFVAIAIYFAILKLRPAPFCILDEIDAALDEINVRKYARYLKKFTDTTQFVLVTHRRSAMEEANVLYGVTMQEDGISKLLRMEQVDFQEDIADIQ